jgi:hypothetical protein
MHARGFKLGTVCGRVAVSMLQRSLQALELQRTQFINACFFNGVQRKTCHAISTK